MTDIDRTDRDLLRQLAAGNNPHHMSVARDRVQRALDLAAGSRRCAGQLVATYDQLAARPVAELSPLRRPVAVAVTTPAPTGDRDQPTKEN